MPPAASPATNVNTPASTTPVVVASTDSASAATSPAQATSAASAGKTEVPLLDYIGNTMRFLLALITNSQNAEHALAFKRAGGVQLLHGFVQLPNLPDTFGSSSSFEALSAVHRAIAEGSPDTDMHELLSEMSTLLVTPPLRAFVESPRTSATLARQSSWMEIPAEVLYVVRYATIADLVLQSLLQQGTLEASLVYWQTNGEATLKGLMQLHVALCARIAALRILSDESSSAKTEGTWCVCVCVCRLW